MAVSPSPKTNHEGMVFQAEVVAGLAKAMSVIGRCVAACQSRCILGQIWRERFVETVLSVHKVFVPPPGSGTGGASVSGPSNAPGNFGVESAGAFACFRRKGSYIDKRLNIRLAVGGLADHHAAIGMAHATRTDGRLDRVEKGANVVAIALHAAQWIGGGDDRIAFLLKDWHDAIPA